MIEIKDLHKRFGKLEVLRGVSLSVDQAEVVVIIGASGSGKTTLLRCINHLEVPDSGEIRLGDRVLFSSSARVNVAPNRRDLGMVFQSYAIWPHLDVAGNVAYPLTVGARRGLYSRTERERRVAALLDSSSQGAAGDTASACARSALTGWRATATLTRRFFRSTTPA